MQAQGTGVHLHTHLAGVSSSTRGGQPAGAHRHAIPALCGNHFSQSARAVAAAHIQRLQLGQARWAQRRQHLCRATRRPGSRVGGLAVEAADVCRRRQQAPDQRGRQRAAAEAAVTETASKVQVQAAALRRLPLSLRKEGNRQQTAHSARRLAAQQGSSSKLPRDRLSNTPAQPAAGLPGARDVALRPRMPPCLPRRAPAAPALPLAPRLPPLARERRLHRCWAGWRRSAGDAAGPAWPAAGQRGPAPSLVSHPAPASAGGRSSAAPASTGGSRWRRYRKGPGCAAAGRQGVEEAGVKRGEAWTCGTKCDSMQRGSRTSVRHRTGDVNPLAGRASHQQAAALPAARPRRQ